VLLVEHLPAAEKHGELDLVTFFKKLCGPPELDVEVMWVGFRSKPDFLQGERVVMMLFVGFAELSLLLIKPFSIIHYPADRGLARWGDFNQVQAGLTSPAYCFCTVNYANLIVRFVDKTNRPGPDTFIGP